MPSLTASDREFFSLLNAVAYGNAFSPERQAHIRRLVPGASARELASDREALARMVEERLPQFREDVRRGALPADDLRLVRGGFLYVCYHRHVPRIDALIARQLSGGDAPLADALAASITAEFAQCGIAEAAALRYFGLFFQLRRAFHFLVRSLSGESASMLRLKGALWNSLFTHDMQGYQDGLWRRMEDFSTLLLGETGSGKGAAAAAIGRSQFIPYLPQKRRFATSFTDGFLDINLAQFPESLIESELFGHRRGAFTGAIADHLGVFSRCSAYGALFLDEIGEVPLPVQIKLLRVLQERSFTPLGSSERQRFAGRVIAATNQPLARLRSSGRFRDDFYYRLCSDVIEVPPLRQRIAESPRELEELVATLVQRVGGEPSQRLNGQVLEVLRRDLPRDYPWPGNVRELEQAVRRILLTGHFSGEPRDASAGGAQGLAAAVEAGGLTARELLAGYCAHLYRRLGSYAAVASRTGLDRRTVRSYIASDPSQPA